MIGSVVRSFFAVAFDAELEQNGLTADKTSDHLKTKKSYDKLGRIDRKNRHETHMEPMGTLIPYHFSTVS